jgi:hypothetical protein
VFKAERLRIITTLPTTLTPGAQGLNHTDTDVKACARTFTGIVGCIDLRGSTMESSTLASPQGRGMRSVYWPGGRCTRKRPLASVWMTRPVGWPRPVITTGIDISTVSLQSGEPGSRGIQGAKAFPAIPLSPEVGCQGSSEALTVSSPTSTPDAANCRTLRIPVRRKRLMIGSAYGQDLRIPPAQWHRRPTQHLTTVPVLLDYWALHLPCGYAAW